MLYTRKTKAEVILDLSPLIDVVFLLLIFFMVSTTFKDQAGLDLTLPDASSRSNARSETLLVAVDRHQKLFVGDQEIQISRLGKVIQNQLQGRSDKTVVLRVDENVPHGMVVSIMDAARDAGAEGITFAAQSEPEEEAEP